MSSDFYSEKTITARKKHRCEVCGTTIEPGQKYVKKAGVHDGDFWNTSECPECQPIIHEFCSTDYGDDGYHGDYINEWWRDEKCPNCKKYYPPCEPDGSCPVDCGDRTKDGKCCAGDTCDEMTRFVWCEKYDPINIQHITNGRQTAYDLAEQYYGDRNLWPIIEKANGTWRYENWKQEEKKYKHGQIIAIPPKPETGGAENG